MGTIRYYPLSRMTTNQQSNGEFVDANGDPYVGPYYQIYTGQIFTGANPYIGANDPLFEPPFANQHTPTDVLNYRQGLSNNQVNADRTGKVLQPVGTSKLKEVVPYTPVPVESDYARGYFKRYFAKRIADRGYIMEVSEEDWTTVANDRDQRYTDYEVADMIWQLRGPRHDTRVSQYQVKGGVLDTNKRITETKAKSFVGLIEFIGGNYTQFARITP